MTIEFNDKNFSVEKIIECLQPQITKDRWQRIQEVVDLRRNSLVSVMENIFDRGNTSAVMRSLEAFGYLEIQHIVLQSEFKESQRVTQGADKWLIQEQWHRTQPCISKLKERGYKVLVTQLEGGEPIDQVDFSQPVALAFGNERDGASGILSEMACQRVFIPMHGFVQSFNISVAAALCFQHIRIQQDQAGVGALTEDEKQLLRAQYLLRSCKSPEKFLY